MAKRNIVIEPDPILRKKSEKLEKVNLQTQKFLDDMLDTMYSAPGIGLAAVQVGVLKRLIVVDISKEDEKKNPLFLINPIIKQKSDKTSIHEEGCLSLPGYFAEIERPAECQVEYLDYNGNKQSLKATGLLSTSVVGAIGVLCWSSKGSPVAGSIPTCTASCNIADSGISPSALLSISTPVLPILSLLS